MTIVYDVLLKRYHTYKPVIGYCGEPNYMCIFYDTNRNKALKEMKKYVKSHGFATPDSKFSVADVILRERESTGRVISDTSYCKLFDVVTGKERGELND